VCTWCAEPQPIEFRSVSQLSNPGAATVVATPTVLKRAGGGAHQIAAGIRVGLPPLLLLLLLALVEVGRASVRAERTPSLRQGPRGGQPVSTPETRFHSSLRCWSLR
jgi:hypothetical protein